MEKVNAREQFFTFYTQEVHRLCEPYGTKAEYVQERLLEGGKFVRPLLFLEALELWKGTISLEALKIATAIELLHNFFLIHDDIMDNDLLRRDVLTVHAYYSQGGKEVEGRGLALIFGDIIYTHSIKLFSEAITNKQLFAEVLDIVMETARGQVAEMAVDPLPDMKMVLEFYKMKTALYSIYLPLLLAQDLSTITLAKEKIKDFSNALGIAYQVYDDLIEIMGMKQRREDDSCGDLLRLKITPLFLKLFEVLSEEQKTYLRQLQKEGKELTHQEEAELKQRMVSEGIVDEIKQLLHKQVAAAQQIQEALQLENSKVLQQLVQTYGKI